MNQGWTPTYSRRTFLHSVIGSLGLAGASSRGLTMPDNFSANDAYTEPAAECRLFDADLPEGQWVQFRAAGYPKSVTGIIYRKRAAGYFSSYVERPWPASGMPLGGIDTGALYLEPSGVLGYSSIFNHITPIGGPLNTPYLAIACEGRSWVFGTGQTKNYAGNNRPSLGINVGGSMQESDYWGHYPIADVQYKSSDAPVKISVRSWSPFIPGDVKVSNIPGAVFEVHLTNRRNSAHRGCLVFNFPGFADHHSRNYAIGWPNMPMKPVMPPPQTSRRPAPDGLKGVWVEEKSWGMSYILAALNENHVRTGGELGFDGENWDAVEKMLPSISEHDDGGSSLAVDYEIGPAEQKVIRVILAWYAPEWEGNGNPGTGGKRILTYAPEGLTLSTTGKRFTHMYAKRFADAGEVAQYLAQNHEQLLRRIIAWQSVIYEDEKLPGWLADALINSFYYFAPCSMWAQAKDPIGDWCKPEDGLFALEESPRACPHVSTLSNLAMAGPLLSLFFPELHVSALKAIRATQRPNGDLAQLLGRWADPANPMSYDYQEVVVGACYMVQAYWHWKIHGDDEFLKEFYPSAKKALEYSFSQRPDLGLTQIIAMPPYRPHTWNDSDWFEDRSYYGYVTDAGGFRLAAAEMLHEWAQKMVDLEEVKSLDDMLTASKRAMQEYLWKDDHYLVYLDPKTGKKLDAFFTPSLNGQYFARFCGVPGVFPPENIEKMIVTLRDKVCKISKLGMPPLYSNPDGTLWKQNDTGYLTGEYIYTNHQVIWNAILAIYEGHRDFGLDLLHKNLELSYCQWGYMWDGTNCCSAGGDTGEVNYGWDYWFNWSIWTAAAALLNQDITALAQPGGLASKMIAAGRSGEPS
jgi:uncharacterized protein (DUF608 family)